MDHHFFSRDWLRCSNLYRRIRSLPPNARVAAFLDHHPSLKPALLALFAFSIALFFAFAAESLDRQKAKAEVIAELRVDPGMIVRLLKRYRFSELSHLQAPSGIQPLEESVWVHQSYDYAWIGQTAFSRYASKSLPSEGWHSVSLNWVDLQPEIMQFEVADQKPHPKTAISSEERDPRAIVY